MKKLFFLLVFLFSFFGSPNSSQAQDPYADALEGCLEQEHIDWLNGLSANLDHRLQALTGHPVNGMSYFKLLEGTASRRLPPSFMLNQTTVDILADMDSTATFNDLWILASQVKTMELEEYGDVVVIEEEEELIPITASGEPKKEEKQEKKEEIDDYYVVNPNSKIWACLIKHHPGTEMRDLLETVQEIPNLSHTLLAEAIVLASKDDGDRLQEPLTRLTIAILLYYPEAATFRMMK